jgi:hypothetical protein
MKEKSIKGDQWKWNQSAVETSVSHVCCSITHNNQEMGMSINSWRIKKMWYTYIREYYLATKIMKSFHLWQCRFTWNKPGTEKQVPHGLTHVQYKKVALIEAKSKMVVIRVQKVRGRRDRETSSFMFLYVSQKLTNKI